MAKQIKAYVEVETYVELNQGRGADPTELVSAVLVVDEFGDAQTRLAETAAGLGPPAAILSGPHGVGKSTVLSTLFALACRPELGSRSAKPQLRNAASYLSGTRLVPVFVDLSEAGPAAFDEALRAAVADATSLAAAAGVSHDAWSAATTRPDALPSLLEVLPPGVRALVIVDGLSQWFRTAERAAGRRAVAEMTALGQLAGAFGELAVVAAVEEDDLEATGAFAQLVRHYHIEYLPAAALSQICHRHIFKKDGRQLSELSGVYDELRRVVPAFRWSREDFTTVYPLHPVILEVAPALRRYASSFSLPRFASAAGNRAKGRRELSLVVLDEPFDQFEYELRKSPELAVGFDAYDFFANTVVPVLPDSQQRLWAKLLLKGLFLLGLAGRSVTAGELAAAMMLFDESDVGRAEAVVRDVLAKFVEQGARRFELEGEGPERRIRLVAADERAGDRVLAQLAREIAPGDSRLADALVRAGIARFPDWPPEVGATRAASEVEVPWRGTWRKGLLSYGVAPAIHEIPQLSSGLPAFDFDPLAGITDDLIDLGFGESAAAAAPAQLASDPATIEFAKPEKICEYDFEVMIVPLGDFSSSPDGPPTLFAWEPGSPDEASLEVLRRIVALESGDPRLEAPGVDVAALKAEAEAEAALVFHKLYIENGRFVGPSRAIEANEHAARETVGGMLARVLDAPFAERFAQHPTFPADLDEATSAMLVEKFFGGTETGSPDVQHAVAAFALPLGLAEGVGTRGPYRFNPSSESLLAAAWNVEPLRLAEAGGEIGVPVEAIYQALRRTPFGLQRPAQRLVVAALVASGRVKLVGPTGELTNENLTSAPALDGYTHLKRAGLTVYTNEVLLEWCRQITETVHLNDIVTADGRQLVRRSLDDWLSTWRELDLNRRFSEVPTEAATRRTWQLIASSKQFFETTARCIEGILSEEMALEEGLGKIVNTFAANPTIYQRALRDLRMLTSFVDWVPFYTYAKEYTLAADRTSEPAIEEQRSELLGFISAPHRLLDESKRRRFETVYEFFRRDYINYYAAAHDLHVGARADFEALDAFLETSQWRRFELLSQVRVVNNRYYQLAQATIQTIRDLRCDLPVREILLERPGCVCSFRLSYADGVPRLLEQLKKTAELGSENYTKTILQYRKSILTGLRELRSEESYADASEPLISLLSGSDAVSEMTPSTIEIINRSLENQPGPVAVTPPPILPGETLTKEALRAKLEGWLDELQVEDGAVIEIARMLPPADE